MNRKKLLAWGWTLIILALCSIPGQDLPRIERIPADKIGHFGIFFMFGLFWLRAAEVKRRYLWVLLGGIFYACFTEVYQGWLPWDRTPDPWDALANTLGVLAALGSYAYLGRVDNNQ